MAPIWHCVWMFIPVFHTLLIVESQWICHTLQRNETWLNSKNWFDWSRSLFCLVEKLDSKYAFQNSVSVPKFFLFVFLYILHFSTILSVSELSDALVTDPACLLVTWMGMGVWVIKAPMPIAWKRSTSRHIFILPNHHRQIFTQPNM